MMKNWNCLLAMFFIFGSLLWAGDLEIKKVQDDETKIVKFESAIDTQVLAAPMVMIVKNSNSIITFKSSLNTIEKDENIEIKGALLKSKILYDIPIMVLFSNIYAIENLEHHKIISFNKKRSGIKWFSIFTATNRHNRMNSLKLLNRMNDFNNGVSVVTFLNC